jgi:branched-chain amino acid transport system substrate-binding protein
MKLISAVSSMTGARVALLIALAIFGEASQADINVGIILSLSGPGASLGAPENDTIKLWPATLAGEKLNVTILNDASDPTAAATAARKLIDEKQVDVLIGSSLTPPSLAIVEVAGAAKVPLLSLAGGSAIVLPQDGPRRWAFKLSPPEPISVTLAMQHMRANKVKTLAYIGLSNAYGDGFLKAVEIRA